jgi:hypothetical protein
VFLNEIKSTGSGALGFAGAGIRAIRVADPSGSPTTWTIDPTLVHAPTFDPAAGVACVAHDGDHLVALVTDSNHQGRLARWPIADLATSDLATPEWWTGSAWAIESATAPAIVIADSATECSLHYDDQLGWIYLASRGFGATTIATRSAPALTGPWSAFEDRFRPPESDAPNAFVYAGKAHPALISPDPRVPLVVTYADNGFTLADVLDPSRAQTLYWPHVALLSLH